MLLLQALITSDTAGLEVLAPSPAAGSVSFSFTGERWAALPARSEVGGRIVAVILGHTLEHFSRGRLRAAEHRVRVSGGDDGTRLSTVLRLNGHPSAVLGDESVS